VALDVASLAQLVGFVGSRKNVPSGTSAQCTHGKAFSICDRARLRGRDLTPALFGARVRALAWLTHVAWAGLEVGGIGRGG
jgi:hypothetical protein